MRAIFEIGGWVKQEQIKDYLDKKADGYIKSNSQISLLEDVQKKALRRKQTLSKRSIFSWLQRLEKEGLLHHKDERYALSSEVVLDYGFVAEIYGSMIWIAIWSIPLKGTTIEERLQDAVNRIGVFVTYLLLYILAPKRDSAAPTLVDAPLAEEGKKFPSKKVDMTPQQVEEYRNLWISNAIPSELMMQIFRTLLIGTIEPQTDITKIAEGREFTEQEYQRILDSFKENNQGYWDKISEQRMKFTNALLFRLATSKSTF
jgi:hypothetical protein